MRYVVKQGDHIAKIARDHGFTDWRPLWDAPENAELRAKRPNPSVVFAGDVLVIPERRVRAEAVDTTVRHRFRVSRRKVKLRLCLEDAFHAPVRNSVCELRIADGRTLELQTDESGRIEAEIPPAAQRADLVLRQGESSLRDVVLEIRIGYLDPLDSFEGQAERLGNLGYLLGRTKGAADPAFVSAVEEFQCDHGLQVDGVCGQLTRMKLEQVHGC